MSDETPVPPAPTPLRLADTPPSGTPNMATPYDLVKLLLAARTEMALLNERLRGLPPPGDVPAPSPATVTQLASNVAKWGAVALGALGLAAQVAAQFKPGLVSPLQTLIQMLHLVGFQ